MSTSTLLGSAVSSVLTGAVFECLSEDARLAPPFCAGVDTASFAPFRLLDSPAAGLCGVWAAWVPVRVVEDGALPAPPYTFIPASSFAR